MMTSTSFMTPMTSWTYPTAAFPAQQARSAINLARPALLSKPLSRKVAFTGLLGAWLARKKLPALAETGRRVLSHSPVKWLLAGAAVFMLLRHFKPKPAAFPVAESRPPYETLFAYSDMLQARKLEASRARFRMEVQLVNTPGGTARYDSLLAQIQEQRELEETLAQKLTCLALAM